MAKMFGSSLYASLETVLTLQKTRKLSEIIPSVTSFKWRLRKAQECPLLDKLCSLCCRSIYLHCWISQRRRLIMERSCPRMLHTASACSKFPGH